MPHDVVLQRIAEAARSGQHDLDLSNLGMTELPPGLDGLRELRSLDLSHNELRRFPVELSLIPHLEVLRLANTDLSTIPPTVSRFTSLQELELANNPLTGLPDAIGALQQLRTLSVSRLDYYFAGVSPGDADAAARDVDFYLPETLGDLSRLTALHLEGLKLSRLPASLARLGLLRTLTLDGNLLTSLPPSVFALRDLDRLSVTNNLLTTLSSDLGNLTCLTLLNLSSNRLQALPSSLGSLHHLRELKLDNNLLTDLPDDLSQLTSLTALWLDDNRFERIPLAVFHLAGLTDLDLRGNALSIVPAQLNELTHLSDLDLSTNRIASIAGDLDGLDKLRSLNLSDNALEQLPASIGNLTSLTNLDLSNNVLASLPAELGNLGTLRELDLHGNHISALPETIVGLGSLISLNLSSNALRSLPRTIGSLSLVHTLDLRANALTEVPREIGLLTNLSALRLDDNNITALPPELSRLVSLTQLWLDRNPLQDFPSVIATLAQLTDLDMQATGLHEVPASIARLTELVELDLRANSLSTLPTAIGQLASLRVLTLDENALTLLPDSLTSLGSLSELSLASNRLAALPANLSNMRSLDHLDLTANDFTDLPADLGALPVLQTLNVGGNRLTSLPLELGRKDELFLAVSPNPLQSPPPEIVDEGSPAVLAYLRERLDDSERQWSAKLLIVGEGGVGKSSLLRSLYGQSFQEGLPTTHGIAVSTLELSHPNDPDVTMQLRAWDFGGQDIYHATHQFFLTNRSLFVVVWNARYGFEQGRLHYWLDTIQALAPESPVLIVATQIDERGPDIPTRELRAQYPQISAFLSISNKTQAGVSDLREAIRGEAAGLPLMGEPWPAAWIGAADMIRRLQDKYVSPTDLNTRLANHGVHGISAKVLVRWLHELGDILHFADGALSEIVILKPQWVSQYISRVLDSDEVDRRAGVFDNEEMHRLWSDLQPGLRMHFLQLMERFDLSYRTLEDREVSLVVERLPRDPPPAFDKGWDEMLDSPETHEVSVRYRLNSVPAGIPTWFIARAHRFTTHTHWRNGALFRYQATVYKESVVPEHLALVQSDPHRRFVQLTVRGPHPHNFFALLMDGFELTLRRFPGLVVNRRVPCPGHDGQACITEFDYEHLLRYSQHGRELIECQASMQDVSVSRLLFGWASSTQDAVLHRIDFLAQSTNELVGDIQRGQDVLIAEFVELRELSQREFVNAYRRDQQLAEASCPNVFVVRRSDRTGVRAAAEGLLGERLELQLYCQQPGCWHPASEGGRYEITDPAGWLQATAPLIGRLFAVLKFAAPIVGPWIGAADPASYTKEMQHDIALMKELVSKLPEIKGVNGLSGGIDVPQREGDDPTGAQGGALRALRVFLDEKDPTQHWGGLERLVTPEGHLLWLCEHHARGYRL